jgi:hypothetical protein
MNITAITLLGLIGIGLASIGQATPVYTGPTAAEFGTGDTGLPGSPASNAAGYYLWTTGDTWSVRWTGNDYGDTTWYDWFGSVELTNLVDGSITSVLFESGHSDGVSGVTDLLFTEQDFIAFLGYAGPHYDGFDFTIDPTIISVVDFELGSSMFSQLTPDPAHVAGMNIFIGQDFNTPLVQVQDWGNGRIVQRFEVASVPEPSTLALMCIGLAGMGFSRWRRLKV